jgi:hypothetical protein
MSNALGNLTKIFEQFKIPGVDTKEIMDARQKDMASEGRKTMAH